MTQGLGGEQGHLNLYYTANRHGEIEPCGCHVNQLGGLHRMKTFLDSDRPKYAKEPMLFVDSGDSFFSASRISENRKDQELLRAKLIAEAYKKMKLDVFTPGERDFAAGIEVLRELEKLSGATFLSSNLVTSDGKELFKKSHIIERGGMSVGLFSLASEKALEGVEGVKVLPPLSVAKEIVSGLREKKVSAIVLLSHMGLPEERELASKVEVNVISGAHSLDILSEPHFVGKAAILQPQNQGQQIGQLRLKISEPLKSHHRLVDLGSEFDGDNEVSKMMEAHRHQVRALAVEHARHVSEPSAEKPFVAHPIHCRTCHEKQYDFWANTKHASAYLVLFAKNQHFDPECVSCHTLGFQSPGGFSRAAVPIIVKGAPKRETKGGEPFVEQLMKKIFREKPIKPLDSRLEPDRYAKLQRRYHQEIKKLEDREKIQNLYIGVQCEHCHGNRHGHPSPDVPTLKKVQEASCNQCHSPPNAHPFDSTTVKEAIKKVGCPLSSSPS